MALIYRRAIFATPRHVRSLSLFDNVKKILSRSAPPSPLPTETKDEKTAEAHDNKMMEKVGARKHAKIIGFKLDLPPRLYGDDLSTGLNAAFEKVLGREETIKQEYKLSLVQEILQRTGRRVPDYILNSANTTSELRQYFQKQEMAKQGRDQVLQLDQERLPSNVKVLS